MRYLILIYSNPASRQIWNQLPAERRSAGLGVYATLNADLDASGEMVVTEALADQSHAKRVSVRAGETITTDGPFAEVKEYLAGFYLVECASVDRAVELAGRIPEAEYGLVEVRPVLALEELAGR